ncbi:sigma 54 modulation/S30EA ribosomal C-terminal domain-containing protein [Mycobacterium sp. SMC-4]|uniref:sigma 54 modulation/S30EA ribosomal C-terminal domain-containing protein n=1 Tax=Mycobacterium sp. SMC-4 TaxID=2857059 RepID=UPI0021B1DE24|nr:sigma 54 modulation/S30EA ribosomal C-terminal domain-containing protein [Mycobacterium sp. SMC-4]UXA18985.1 sigma 54 modulation/S30EA ribosomal C-terminal domain-containing protein [Mycobacterium sp. SMC-4]
MSNGAQASPDLAIDVTARDESPGVVEYAREKIAGLARFAHRPIAHARVRVTRSHDLAVGRPVIAQANLDVAGRPVRAQVQANTAQEALDALAARLRRRLEHVTALWEAPKGPDAAPPWRGGATFDRMPRPVPRGGDEPRIVRRKTFAMAPCTVDDAIADMETLDYDFHLFTEIGSGATAVVYRGGPTGYRLALVAPALAGEVAPFTAKVTISPHPLPCLREQDALERLGLLDLPFLFFIDAAQGRASALYRRFDGDYAVITPAG